MYGISPYEVIQRIYSARVVTLGTGPSLYLDGPEPRIQKPQTHEQIRRPVFSIPIALLFNCLALPFLQMVHAAVADLHHDHHRRLGAGSRAAGGHTTRRGAAARLAPGPRGKRGLPRRCRTPPLLLDRRPGALYPTRPHIRGPGSVPDTVSLPSMYHFSKFLC